MISLRGSVNRVAIGAAIAAVVMLLTRITQAEHVVVGPVRPFEYNPPSSNVEKAPRVSRAVVRHGPDLGTPLVDTAHQASAEMAKAASDAARAAADAARTAADAAKSAGNAAKAAADSVKAMTDATRLAAGIREDDHRANTVAKGLGQVISQHPVAVLVAVVLAVVAVVMPFLFVVGRNGNEELAKGGKKRAARAPRYVCGGELDRAEESGSSQAASTTKIGMEEGKRSAVIVDGNRKSKASRAAREFDFELVAQCSQLGVFAGPVLSWLSGIHLLGVHGPLGTLLACVAGFATGVVVGAAIASVKLATELFFFR
jgi:hypothetical protein